MKKTDEIFLQAVSHGLKAQIMEDPCLTEKEWEILFDQSVRQSLLPLVFEAVYPYLSEDLEKKYRSNTLSWIMGQVRAEEEFIRTYQALQEQNIEPLVFKGIVCRNAYRLPDWRISGDEDIYVPQEHYMRLHTCFKSMGFRSKEPNFRSEHETIYYGKSLVIEGHWDMFPHEHGVWKEINDLSEEFMQRAVHLSTGGINILTLEPTDHMIYLLLHAMKHFALSGVGIRQICDVAVWGEKYVLDWDRVKDTLKKSGSLIFAEAVLDAGIRYFDMNLPEGWERRDCTNLVLDSLGGGTFGHASSDRLHSASMTSVGTINGQSAAVSLIKAVFPSRTVMEINYPWVAGNRLLLPVGWTVRLFRYIRKIEKNNTPLGSIRIGMQRMKLLEEYGVLQAGNSPEEP